MLSAAVLIGTLREHWISFLRLLPFQAVLVTCAKGDQSNCFLAIQVLSNFNEMSFVKEPASLFRFSKTVTANENLAQHFKLVHCFLLSLN